MEFRFTPEQTAIADAASAFLAQHATPAKLKNYVASHTPMDQDLWRAVTHDMGWLGVAVPESLGGAGLTAVELAILMQESGAALSPIPLFATTALAIPAILAAATHQQQAELIPPIMSGAAATFGFTNEHATPGPEGVTAELRRENNIYKLTGQTGFVPHAAAAKTLIIACRAPNSQSTEGLSLVALSTDHRGLHATHHTTLDLTRPYSTIRFQNVEIPQSAILGAPESAAAAFIQTLSFAAAMLAAEQLGGAERVLALSVEHAKTRIQFNRPIGSFQAIKHKLADMKLLVESARSAAYYAACTAAESPENLAEAASIARACCSDGFTKCAAEAIQIHGGMGFTWDHPAHLYFKRARSSATLLGDPTHHREKIAQLMGLSEAAA